MELTFEVAGDDGKPVRFGSVGGGGRYDGLIGRFRAEDVPATGISIGVSRLQAALTHLGKLKTEAPQGPVVVTVMDKDRIAEYQQMVSELRNSHLDKDGRPIPGVLPVKAELYLGDSGFKAQMKYCDRRNSPVAIIQGSDEAARGEVQIKDLVRGAAVAEQAKDHHGPRGVPEAPRHGAIRREARGAGCGGQAGAGLARHRRGASFEASAGAEAPQDEEGCALQPPKVLILRRFAEQSLEGRTTTPQPSPPPSHFRPKQTPSARKS